MDRPRFIRCLSPFVGGTRQPCEGGRSYHFLPNEHGHYVAEVIRDDDYEKILSIGAGFQPYWPAEAEKAQQEAAQDVLEARELAKETDEQIASDSATARASMAAAADQERARIAKNREQLARAREMRGKTKVAEA
jgi:hypothetical protein